MRHPLLLSFRRLARLACAAAFACATSAHAHNFCATTAQELQDALDAVSDGGAYVNEDNSIAIVAGTYRTGSATGGDAFHSTAMTTTHALTIEGGFLYDSSDPDGCAVPDRALPAPFTVLDAHGISGVMRLVRPNGRVNVELLTIQNGAGNNDVGGLGINALTLAEVTAPIDLRFLIFLNNHSETNAGGLFALGASASQVYSVYLSTVLFAGNGSGVDYGAANIRSRSGRAWLHRITAADNQAPAGATGGVYCGGGDECAINDSIFRGNTNFGLFMDSLENDLYCSDYGQLGGTLDFDEDNLSVPPNFVDADHGDYHLAGNSPLLARCVANDDPDLDNHEFSNGGRTDMGAYAETIFFDDFEAH